MVAGSLLLSVSNTVTTVFPIFASHSYYGSLLLSVSNITAFPVFTDKGNRKSVMLFLNINTAYCTSDLLALRRIFFVFGKLH